MANNKRPLCPGSGKAPIMITLASEAEPWQAGGMIGRHARGNCAECGRDMGLTANDLLMPHVPPRGRRPVEGVLLATATEAGWTLESRTDDGDGNVRLSLRRHRTERLSISVYTDPALPGASGRLWWARDEHMRITGTTAILNRVREPNCPFCPQPKESTDANAR